MQSAQNREDFQNPEKLDSILLNFNPTLREALRLAELGYKVFACRAGSTEPLGLQKQATTDAEQLKRWWTMCPTANLAIITDGLVVIELKVDHESGQPHPWLVDDALLESLAVSPTIDTPQGHRYHLFREPVGRGYRDTTGQLARQVDTHATGGYILLPPSLIGKEFYIWNNDQPVTTRRIDLAIPPKWLIAMLDALREGEAPAEPLSLHESSEFPSPQTTVPPTSSPGEPEGVSPRTIATSNPQDAQSVPGLTAPGSPESMVYQPILTSERHHHLTRYAAQMRRFNATPAEILAAISMRNRTQCQPPLFDDEVVAIARDALHTEADPVPAKIVQGFTDEELAEDDYEMDAIDAEDVEEKEVQWLWRGRIPLGKVTLICGDPGNGKSFLSLDMTARVTRGGGWPDDPDFRANPGRVLILNCEDDPGDTLKPRLRHAGADLSLVRFVNGIKHTDPKIKRKRGFDLVHDVPRLRKELQKYRDFRLVIIDPVSAYCGKIDSHNNTEVRAMLAPVSALAAQYGVAIVLITHLSKSGSGRAVHRAMGSLAFTAAARGVWGVAKDPDDPERRLFIPVKSNIGRTTLGLGYRIVGDTNDPSGGRIIWDDKPVQHTSDELLAGDPQQCRVTKSDSATQWLQNFLAEGPKLASEIYAAGEGLGFSVDLLKTAKSRIKAEAIKEHSKTGKWIWALPHSVSHAGETSPSNVLDVSI